MSCLQKACKEMYKATIFKLEWPIYFSFHESLISGTRSVSFVFYYGFLFIALHLPLFCTFTPFLLIQSIDSHNKGHILLIKGQFKRSGLQ